MKLTKYEHACVVLEDRGKKLVVDPGGFTKEFGTLESVVGVVVTHVHADHFNPDHLEAILVANPEATIFTTTEVAEQFQKPNVKVVRAGEAATIGPFSLRFGGEMHALIHASLPRPQNTSVLVNDAFYYPGDSYTLPGKPVEILAVPANAPWMKIADSMDFIAAVKPKQCFPTHNGLLNENGRKTYDFGLGKACEDNGVTYTPLDSGESLEIESGI